MMNSNNNNDDDDDKQKIEQKRIIKHDIEIDRIFIIVDSFILFICLFVYYTEIYTSHYNDDKERLVDLFLSSVSFCT